MNRINTMVEIWERINNKSVDLLLEEKINKERVELDSFEFDINSMNDIDGFNGVDIETVESLMCLGSTIV
jgi:hypothetical protein